MKITIPAIILLFLSINLFAQNNNANTKPSWLTDIGKPESNYYDYFIGFGENTNLQKAREKSIDDVYTQISDEIKSSYKVGGFSTTSIKNINTQSTVDFEFVGTVEKTGETITVSGIKEVETYYIQTGSNYQYWVLLRKPKQGAKDAKMQLYTFDKSSIWRSVVYSGWGQMYNRKPAKGIALLCGETLGLSGVILGQIMYSNNIDQAAKIMDKNRIVYLDNAHSWETVRNISGIVAGAVWIYNIIDITTSSKPKIYSFNQPMKLKIYPTISKQNNQLHLTLNF